MKLNKYALCIMSMLYMFSLISCGIFGSQKYVCDVEDVEYIQIVRLAEYVEEEYRFEYDVIAEISDCSAFVERLNNLKYSVNWGDPIPLYADYTVINIVYKNGDYDLIHSDGQWFHRSGVKHNGFCFFDDEEFETLISDCS